MGISPRLSFFQLSFKKAFPLVLSNALPEHIVVTALLLSLPGCSTNKKKITISPTGRLLASPRQFVPFGGLCLFPLASLHKLIFGSPVHMMNLIYSSVDNRVTGCRASYTGGPLIVANAETTRLQPLAMSLSSCLKRLSLWIPLWSERGVRRLLQLSRENISPICRQESSFRDILEQNA